MELEETPTIILVSTFGELDNTTNPKYYENLSIMSWYSFRSNKPFKRQSNNKGLYELQWYW